MPTNTGVPKSFLYGLVKETQDPEDPNGAWGPVQLDGFIEGGNGGFIKSTSVLFNEFADGGIGAFNRERSNENPIIIDEETRNSDTDSDIFFNINAKGGHFVVNVLSITGSPSITVKIQGVTRDDFFSPNFYDILVGSPITATGITVLKVYPGISTLAGGAASDILPWAYRVRVEHANADDIEYSVDGNLVV